MISFRNLPRTAFLVGVIVIAPFGLAAQDQYVFVGIGGGNCAEEIAAANGSDFGIKNELDYYVLGFIEGQARALEVPRPKDSFAVVSAKFQTYCLSGHKNFTVNDAAVGLFRETYQKP